MSRELRRDADADLPIVDAHHHLWDLEGALRYPWLISGEHAWLGDYSRIRRTYLPDEYRRDSALHKVIATVHVEAECDRSMQIAETEWLTRMHAEHRMPNAIVAHAWVDTPNAEEILAGICRFPLVRGIRTKPVIADGPNGSVRGQPRSLQDPVWRKGLGLLEKYGLSWDLRVPWYHLEEAAEVCREHPTMHIVLNHTGYPLDRSPEALQVWRRGMEALALCPNVWCKISGLTVKGQPWTMQLNEPVTRQAISVFGVDRCMFASNFPVDGVKASWDWIYCCFKRATADMPEAARRKLFADNAVAFYRIQLPETH
ncbi:MAG: amidohydrolase family protein [Acetobacteraceae bacterium]|nr:amidohydrolase family protein [Acetobacteraceae bacterium]